MKDTVLEVCENPYEVKVHKNTLTTTARRAENDYLKNLQALVLEDERRQHKKRW